jgi:hypothetical protein
MNKFYTFSRASIIFFLLLTVLAFNNFKANAQPCTTLSISSTNVTDASCPSGGGIQVIASGTSLVYQLIAGPSGYSTASNTTGIFGTLNAGAYTVEVRDACGVKVTTNVTVNNTYPAFSVSTATVTNVCTASVQGGTVNANITGGKPPYQYDIVPLATTPVYGAATASTSFNKVVNSFGTYRVYAKDNCGEVRTYDILVQATQPIPTEIWYEEIELNRPCGETIDGLATVTWVLHLEDENGSPIDFNQIIGASYSIYKPVVPNSITNSEENCTTPVGALLSSGTIILAGIDPDDNRSYPLVIPQQDVILIITTTCGSTLKYCYNFNDGNPIGLPDAVFNLHQRTCTGVWSTQTSRIKIDDLYNMILPVTYQLTTINGTIISNSTGTFNNLLPSDFPLSIVTTDACGKTVTKNFNMPTQGSALQFTVNAEWALSCSNIKNTATAEINITGGDLPGIQQATNIVITGGTVTAVPAISGYIDWLPGYKASNLLAGYTYKVVITNLCGEKDSVEFTVPNDHWGQETLNYNLTATVNALCGQNKSTIIANAAYTGDNTVNYYLYNLLSPNTAIANNTNGVFNDVTPGNYKIKFVVPSTTSFCPTLEIKDSINTTILADGGTQTIMRKTITTCEVGGVPTTNGKAIVEVSGSAPFTYEIIRTNLIGTGGEIWTVSSSNNPSSNYTWNIPLSGDPLNTVYTLRTTDKCGNKVTTQASLQPMNAPAVNAQNNPCIGSLDYTLTVAPYGGAFTYSWVKLPDVATVLSTQNTITFPGAYSAVNNGTYRCFVSLAGCIDRNTDVTINSDNCNFALPIKLVSFTGGYSNGVASLKWAAQNEINFKQYELERSVNGVDFLQIETVSAKPANSATNDYTYIDKLSNYTEKTVYYRLKIIDKDGRFEYSSIIRLIINGGFKGMNIYPNPLETDLSISFSSETNTPAVVKIIDKTGRMVLTQKIQISKGVNAIKVPVISELKAGAYMLIVQTNTSTETTKFIKL